jgi:hypothetical protein
VGSPRGEYNEFLVLLVYTIQLESRPVPCIPFDIDGPMHMHVGVCVHDTSFFSSLCLCQCCLLLLLLLLLFIVVVVVVLPRHNIDPLFFFSQICMFLSIVSWYLCAIGMQYCINTTRTLSTRREKNIAYSFHFIHSFIFRQFVGQIHCSIEDTTTSSL